MQNIDVKQSYSYGWRVKSMIELGLSFRCTISQSTALCILPYRHIETCNSHTLYFMRYGIQFYLATILFLHFTRCSAIAERPRCRVRYSFRQK